MTKDKAKKVAEILEGIDVSVTPEDIESLESVDEVEEYLRDNGLLDVEIIYYSRAMEYLSEHDNSLTRGMELAADMGYSLEKINSELLASLVASEDMQESFSEVRDEIEEVLS